MTDQELSSAAARELQRASQRKAREVLAEARALMSRGGGENAAITVDAIRQAWSKLSVPSAGQPRRSGFSPLYAVLAAAVVGGCFLAFEMAPARLTRVGGAVLVLGAVALCYVLASPRLTRGFWRVRHRGPSVPSSSWTFGRTGQLAGDELREAPEPVLMAARTAQTSSPIALAAWMMSIGTVVITVFVFGIVIWWLAVVLSKSGVAPVVSSKGAVIVDQYQHAKDILLVVLPFATAAVGYWFGSHGRAKAQAQAQQAQDKITAVLGSSDDGELLKKAASNFPAAFPELSHTGPISHANAPEAGAHRDDYPAARRRAT